MFPNAKGAVHESANLGTRLIGAQRHFGFVDADGNPNTFTSHDLRRTCSSYLRKLRVNDDVRAGILNHTGGKSVTEAHHAVTDIDAEKYEALALWQGTLDAIAAGGNPFKTATDDIREIDARIFGSNVVPLRAVA